MFGAQQFFAGNLGLHTFFMCTHLDTKFGKQENNCLFSTLPRNVFFFSQAESDWPLCAVELNSAMYAAKVRMVKAGKYGKRGKGAEGTIPKLVLASLGE